MKQYIVFEDEQGQRTEIEIGRMDVSFDGEDVTIKCPECGVTFAKYAAGLNFSFTEHIICCGKLRA